jgi:hypothetical protein
MGWEGMCLTTMVDLQCVSFEVEGEPEAETTEGRGREAMGHAFQKRRGDGGARWRKGESVMQWHGLGR